MTILQTILNEKIVKAHSVAIAKGDDKGAEICEELELMALDIEDGVNGHDHFQKFATRTSSPRLLQAIDWISNEANKAQVEPDWA